MRKELLIVDDDLPFRERLSRSMEKKGFSVESFSSSKETQKRINSKNFDYAIVDMRLEDGSGLELIKNIKKSNPTTKSLLLTGYGNIATAVAAVKSVLIVAGCRTCLLYGKTFVPGIPLMVFLLYTQD